MVIVSYKKTCVFEAFKIENENILLHNAMTFQYR